MTAAERQAAGAAPMRARRAAVQADRRIAGAILRGAGGSRAMAAARARHQADARRGEAEHLTAIGNHPGAADLRQQAERLDRAAVILGGDA